MTVLEAVQKSGSMSAMHKGSIKAADKQLAADEQVFFAFTANVSVVPVSELSVATLSVKNKLSGVVVITHKRVLFCNSVLGVGSSKQISLNNIQSIDDKTNMLGLAAIRICGITEMFVIDGNQKLAEQIKNAINEAIGLSRSATAAPVSTAVSPMDEIKKLKELLDMGAVTQAEFDIKKKQLLNI